MSSTFAGLNTAASALAAARAAMNTTGQNLANERTPGYTRQRVEFSSVPAPGGNSLWGQSNGVGGGVSIDKVARLGNDLLDARVRDSLAASGFWNVRATNSAAVESLLAEPTTTGLAATLDKFWAGWSDLANNPDETSAGAVLTNASVLASQIATGYNNVANQWSDLRAGVDRQVADINGAADRVAKLNGEIRNGLQSGRNVNELIDQRNLLAQNLASTAGVTGTMEADGTMTLRIDGNPLVSGDSSRMLVTDGPNNIADGGNVTVAWADRPGSPIPILGGELGGSISVLAPASAGGTLASVAAAYNDAATTLATTVNALHQAGVTSAGAPGGDFFSLDASGPAALGLGVIPTGIDSMALAKIGGGALDTSIAEQIGALSTAKDGASATWGSFVTKFAITVAADVKRADVADSGAISAVTAQQSTAAVDADEETVNLLTSQTAYQAAARVLTAVDEALDILINRTGIVGR